MLLLFLINKLTKSIKGEISMTDKEKQIRNHIAQANPTDAESHVLTFAFCQVMYGATQKQYVEVAGFSDRLLRTYISDNRKAYDEELERIQGIKEADSPSPDFTLMANRTITEEQLDKFVDALFKSAVNGNARDKQLFIEFTGLTSEQVLTLQKNKAKSLRYWIRGELDSISTYMDTKSLGLMSESSELIYRGDKASAKNAQTYVNKDINDEAFMRELAYWGAVHLNLLNNVSHPDTELLATAVRLDRLESGVKETFNKYEVKKYANGQPISDVKKTATDDELARMLSEVFTANEVEDIMYQKRMAQDIVKAPTVDRVSVDQRATKYQDELIVILTAEEQMRQWMKDITKKVTN